MLVPYQERVQILDDQLQFLDNQLQQLYSRIREVQQQRNRLVPINQLPTEVLCRIFVEVGTVDTWITPVQLLWHPDIVHVCRQWRTIGLDVPTLWECIYPPERVTDEALRCYISRAGKSQNIKVVNKFANWERILTSFHGLDRRIASVGATDSASITDFLRVGCRFQILSSVVSLQFFEPLTYMSRQTTTLPPHLPFFAPSHQPHLRSLSLEVSDCIPWQVLQPQFTGLRAFSACVPITGRDNCLAFVNALEHMVSLEDLRLNQPLRCATDLTALEGAFHVIKARTRQQTVISPTTLYFTSYGQLELQILFLCLSFANIRFISLRDIPLDVTGTYPSIYQILHDRLPKEFLESTRHLVFHRLFVIKGFKKSEDPSEVPPDSCNFEISGFRLSAVLPESQVLRGFIDVAKLLAPEVVSLGLGCLDLAMLDGRWPALTIIQNFPHIRSLSIEVDAMINWGCLTTSGLSCLWRAMGSAMNTYPSWRVWDSQWSWSSLQDEELALGFAGDNWVYPLHPVCDSETTILGLEEEEVYGMSDREEFHALVSSLVPGLETLQIWDYDISDGPSLDFLRSCLFFRAAIGLPIAKVQLHCWTVDESYPSKLKDTGTVVDIREY